MPLINLPRPFVIVGGVATTAYMPERTTLDIDILIHPGDRDDVHAFIARDGGAYQGELSIGGSSWLLKDGTSLDILESDEEWATSALSHPNRMLDGSPVIQLRYLVLMKLKASRPQDLADISRMMARADEEAVERTRNTIAQSQPDAIEDLESLIAIGRLENDDANI